MTRTIRRPIPIVRVLVVNSHGQVLVIQRAPDTTDGNRWCLPGGKVDYGETVEQAAGRELQEETGIEASGLLFMFYRDSLPETPESQHYLQFYLTCSSDRDPALNCESIAFRWITLRDIHSIDIAFGDDQAIARFFALRAV